MTARPFGWIYKITAPNGKAYIGQTRLRPQRRINLHHNVAKRGGKTRTPLLTAALQKWGKLCRAEVIAQAKTQKHLDELEMQMINKHNTLTPHGLNLLAGGVMTRLPAKDTNLRNSTKPPPR